MSRRYLARLSLLYLAVPYLLFFAGWLRWVLALVCTGFLVLTLLWYTRRRDRLMGASREASPGPPLNWQRLLLLLLVCILLVSISGIGGYGYQDTDWLKHNAILKELVTRPWPAQLELEGQKVPLVYYIAYYLPAALLGKLGGWRLANHALATWSLIGLALAMLWFLVLNRRHTWSVVALFLAFSGLDIVGQWVIRSFVAPIRPEVLPLLTWDHIENWAIGWQYSSNATLLFWVPHQAIAGWITAGALVDSIEHPRGPKHSLLWLGLTTLWSPFVTLGTLPFLLAEPLLEEGHLLERLRRYLSLPNLCGLLVAAVVGLYYGAKLSPVSPILDVDIPHGFSLGVAPDTQARAIGLALMLLFCLLEYGLYGLLIFRANRGERSRSRPLLLTALITLSLIPLYRYGSVNDWAMRASIPALLILALFLGRALHGQRLGVLARTVLIALVILGSVTAFIEVDRHILGIWNEGALVRIPELDQVAGISQWGLESEKDATIIRQYVGGNQSPFFRYLANNH